MKTILQALIDEMDYPFSQGKLENKLMARSLNPADEVTFDILIGKEFRGTVADCLYSLVEAVNFSEADKSISLPDRNAIMKKANSIYKSIGESEKCFGEPKVYIGG